MTKVVREFHSLLVKIAVIGERGRGLMRVEREVKMFLLT